MGRFLKYIFVLYLFITIDKVYADKFPDGSPISEWFDINVDTLIDTKALGKFYKITDYGVINDSTLLQTDKIQTVIDYAARNGGGVIYIPQGTFLSSSLFLRKGTHLYIEEGGVLKGSDDIGYYPVLLTRIEGQNCNYFGALINVENNDGCTIWGKGKLDGNGFRYWRSFWKRVQVIKNCTNKDELRPRLLYVSNSNNVIVKDLTLQNSPFWTSHYYKCDSLRLVNLRILSPPHIAPSTDAIDLDVCNMVLIKGCSISVNDDAIALKGGKGPWSDRDPQNGPCTNVIVDNCQFGFCHSMLTCGSESIFCYNIVVRNCILSETRTLLTLKMRPDTPQQYKYIKLENIKGSVHSFMMIQPWTQFMDLQDRKDIPMSFADNISFCNLSINCEYFWRVKCMPEQYRLSNFFFDNVNVFGKEGLVVDKDCINGLVIRNFNINNKRYDEDL